MFPWIILHNHLTFIILEATLEKYVISFLDETFCKIKAYNNYPQKTSSANPQKSCLSKSTDQC